jgi:hypothetical protein
MKTMFAGGSLKRQLQTSNSRIFFWNLVLLLVLWGLLLFTSIKKVFFD